MVELCDQAALELHGLLKKREVSARELVQSVFRRIAEVESGLNAFITITEKEAFVQAERADEMIKGGEIGLLTGIPFAVKDIISVKGIPTTCGSNMLRNYRAVYDATVIEKLREAGAVFVGKTNMDEFGMGSSTETSCFGAARNPSNPEYVPGGSSGGSAAATAARECIVSLGSDTGGSVRQPACYCGIVGLKPTYGRVSRYGLVAFASSLDQVGPMTLDVPDCAAVLQAISGYDPRDSTSAARSVPDYLAGLGSGLEGLRVGIPREYMSNGMDPEVQGVLENAMKDLEAMGAKTVEISLPHMKYAVAAYYIIAPAEASSNLARYNGVRYGLRENGFGDIDNMIAKSRTSGFGSEVIRRIVLGTYALSAGYRDAYYRKASQVRTLVARDFKEAFDICDMLLTPVTPTPAFKIGEKAEKPLEMYLSDIFTLSANLAGIPGLSLPYGVTDNGLPVGIQLLGDFFEEERLLSAGFALEQRREARA